MTGYVYRGSRPWTPAEKAKEKPYEEKKPPVTRDVCGTPKGYHAHLRNNEHADEACKVANAAYNKAGYHRRKKEDIGD